MIFRSFFLARVDRAADQDAAQIAASYRVLRDTGVWAAREAVRWPTIDRKGHYDFSTLVPFLDAAQEQRIDVIWDLFHAGYPPDLDPFRPAFIHRFASYCAAAARFIQARTPGTCWFTPIDQPSYFAWAGGETGRMAPHSVGEGHDLKLILARAAIAGINAIRSVCPGARMVSVDPLCHVVPPIGTFDRYEICEAFNQGAVFEFWDLLSGRSMPELGGSREHLDVVGIHTSPANQWEIARPEQPLPANDPRRIPLRRMVRRVWERYGGELLLTQAIPPGTSHAEVLSEVERECEAILAEGIPLRGLCLPAAPCRSPWDASEGAGSECRARCQAMLDALHASPRGERQLRMGAHT